MLRWLVATLIGALAASGFAETLITPAKIVEVTERGLVLMVGTEPLAVEDSVDTRVWRNFTAGKRDSLQKGDQVFARIKTDSDPPLLREIADDGTWKWLESVRKTHRKGMIDKIDAKYLHMKFEDGTRFAYRLTEKSDLKLKSKSTASISDLSAGMTVFVKGRLLPTLDTWVAELTDTAPAEKPKVSSSKSTAAKKPKIAPLPASGKLEGIILGEMPPLKMFDILVDEIKTYHITYNLETKYYGNGKASDRSVLQNRMKVLVTYKRDKYGRLVASKVEVFSR